MKTVILCGGHGTRIRDVAENIPKPMITVGRYPILWHIMKYYASFNHNEFILCLGYKGNNIKEFFLNYEAQTRDLTLHLGATKSIKYHTDHDESNWSVTLSDTGLESLTGSRIKKIQKYIGNDEHFMLTYGDGVCDVNLHELIKYHLQQDRVLTVTGVRPPGRFGELVSEKGIVTEFNEKPQTSGGRISGGYFVCRRDIFNYLETRDDLVFEQEPMQTLVTNKQLAVYEHNGFWQCMDTYRDWQYLNGLYDKGQAPWMIW